MILNERMCKDDLLNKEGTRNVKNMNKSEYNCGGYALETFNWYCPYTKEMRGLLFDSWESDYDYDETIKICVDYMLEEFKGELRVIEDVSELQEGEYAIAFRISEGDFHYAKRTKNGRWFHKMGGKHRIDTMRKTEVFGSNWCWRYDSKVTLFAKKRTLLNQEMGQKCPSSFCLNFQTIQMPFKSANKFSEFSEYYNINYF